MIEKRIVSHYDLDGFTSAIVARNAFPSARIDFFNYADSTKTLQGIINEQLGKETLFVILDFRIEIEQIGMILKHKEFSLVHIDHHEIDQDFIEKRNLIKAHFKNRFLYRHDLEKAGCLLAYEFFTRIKPMKYLEELVNVVNVYDLWKTDDPLFMEKGVPLNEIAWHLKDTKFMETFAKGLSRIKDEDLQNYLSDFEIRRSKYMSETLEQYSMTTEVNDQKVLSIIRPDIKFINLYSIYYPEYQYYIIFKGVDWKTKCNNFSLRIRGPESSTNQIAQIVINERDPLAKGGGHKNSGGIVFQPEKDIEIAHEDIMYAIKKIENG